MNTTTTPHSKALFNLHSFFESLDCDLNHALAAGLARKINAKTGDHLTAEDIFHEYESWQNDAD